MYSIFSATKEGASFFRSLVVSTSLSALILIEPSVCSFQLAVFLMAIINSIDIYLAFDHRERVDLWAKKEYLKIKDSNSKRAILKDVEKFYREKGISGEHLKKILEIISINKTTLFKEYIDIATFYKVGREPNLMLIALYSISGSILGISISIFRFLSSINILFLFVVLIIYVLGVNGIIGIYKGDKVPTSSFLGMMSLSAFLMTIYYIFFRSLNIVV